MVTETQIKGVKEAAKLLAGTSVGFVVKSALKNTVAANTKVQKLYLIIGSTVLCGLASDAAVDRVETKIDNLLRNIDILEAEEVQDGE